MCSSLNQLAIAPSKLPEAGVERSCSKRSATTLHLQDPTQLCMASTRTIEAVQVDLDEFHWKKACQLGTRHSTSLTLAQLAEGVASGCNRQLEPSAVPAKVSIPIDLGSLFP